MPQPPIARRVLPLLAALCLTAPALAQRPIQFEGVERSDAGFLDGVVDRCRRSGMLDEPAAVESCVYDTKLFSRVEVTDGPDALIVSVDERWTLIPLPVVRSSDGEIEGGVFLLETNLFGMGKLLVAGGLFGTRGSQIRVIARDPAIAYSDWTATLRFARQTTALRLEDGGAVLDAFEELAYRVEPTIGYQLTPWFELNASAAFVWRSYDGLDGYAAPTSLDDVSLGLGASLKQTRFRLYFDEGLRLAASGLRQVYRSDDTDDRAWLLTLAGSYQHQAWADHAVQLSVKAGAHIGGDARTAPRLGGGPGLRGVPVETGWSRRHAAVGLDYQVPVWRPSFGTLTVAPFVDGALIDLEARDAPRRLWQVAAGAGTYVFLSDVAFPGLGVVAGYEFASQSVFATVALGAGF